MESYVTTNEQVVGTPHFAISTKKQEKKMSTVIIIGLMAIIVILLDIISRVKAQLTIQKRLSEHYEQQADTYKKEVEWLKDYIKRGQK